MDIKIEERCKLIRNINKELWYTTEMIKAYDKNSCHGNNNNARHSDEKLISFR